MDEKQKNIKTRAFKGFCTEMKKILFFLPLFFLMGCSDSVIKNKLELDSTSVLDSDSKMVVVVSPYVRVSDTPYEDSITVSHLRLGDIQPFVGREYVNNSGNIEAWVNIGTGWIKAENCKEYDSREKAETAARLLLE